MGPRASEGVGTSRRERFAQVWPTFVVSGLTRRSSQQGAVAPRTRRRSAVSWAAANRFAPTAIRAAPRPTPRNAPVASRHRRLAGTLASHNRTPCARDRTRSMRRASGDERGRDPQAWVSPALVAVARWRPRARWLPRSFGTGSQLAIRPDFWFAWSACSGAWLLGAGGHSYQMCSRRRAWWPGPGTALVRARLGSP